MNISLSLTFSLISGWKASSILRLPVWALTALQIAFLACRN